MSYKDDVMQILDEQVLDLLTRASALRITWKHDRELDDLEAAQTRRFLLDAALDLENAAVSIASDASTYHLISWNDYRVIRNIIDHIGTGERMEDLVW